ncbi:MAG: MerR family transcriptional regulator [Actinomycetales bacterium]|jgi:DNA-binding transcriptional MerR regulator|nr:MerR family transcriptional regulator [Actinomycetales bacterium]
MVNIDPTQAPVETSAADAIIDEYSSDMLFTDGLPSVDPRTGYRGTSAAAAAGITYRQLDYWDRTGLVQPSVRPAGGSGSQRLYAFRDILVLKLVKRLLDTGVSLQQIRIAVDQLRAAGINDLGRITLMSDGARVYLCTTEDEVIDLLGRGQGVFGIAVGRVLREVEASLVNMVSNHIDEIDELAARRQNKQAV